MNTAAIVLGKVRNQQKFPGYKYYYKCFLPHDYFHPRRFNYGDHSLYDGLLVRAVVFARGTPYMASVFDKAIAEAPLYPDLYNHLTPLLGSPCNNPDFYQNLVYGGDMRQVLGEIPT